MPDPREVRSVSPPPIWPADLPAPQSDSMRIVGPLRAEYCDVLSGPTRVRVHARTAPQTWAFECWFTPAQMERFESWYRDIVAAADGEFYAHWIGGGRVVAFSAPYAYSAVGTLWVLSGTVIRTRIDYSVCDAAAVGAYGNLWRDDGSATALLIDNNISAVDAYIDDFDLALIKANEC